jgi:hypothetical protein
LFDNYEVFVVEEMLLDKLTKFIFVQEDFLHFRNVLQGLHEVYQLQSVVHEVEAILEQLDSVV